MIDGKTETVKSQAQLYHPILSSRYQPLNKWSKQLHFGINLL